VCSSDLEEIRSGRLPQINSDKIFLKRGEICHSVDKAILLKDKIKKSYVRNGGGYSMPGFFKGTRVHVNRGRTRAEEEVVREQFRGILYITNQRVIFQASKNAFEKPHAKLTSIAPYSNAVELQYSAASYSLLVPDGSVVNTVLDLLNRGGC
jgi:hypothetical protein